MSTRTVGNMGEESAALYLQKEGYTILSRNVRFGHLEVDIIAKNDTHLVFAEVKTRRCRPGTRSPFGRPADAVDARKRQNLLSALRAWQQTHRGECDALIPNIDIIEVYTDPSSAEYRVLEIRHYKNAVNGMKGF